MPESMMTPPIVVPWPPIHLVALCTRQRRLLQSRPASLNENRETYRRDLHHAQWALEGSLSGVSPVNSLLRDQWNVRFTSHAERVVNDQWNAVLVSDLIVRNRTQVPVVRTCNCKNTYLGELWYVAKVILWVTDCLHIQSLGAIVDSGGEIIGLIRIDKFYSDAQSFEGDYKSRLIKNGSIQEKIRTFELIISLSAKNQMRKKLNVESHKRTPPYR